MRRMIVCFAALMVALAGCNAAPTVKPPATVQATEDAQARHAAQMRADAAKRGAAVFLRDTRKKVEAKHTTEERLSVIVAEYCSLLRISTEYGQGEIEYWKVNGLDMLFDEYWRHNDRWVYPIWEAANLEDGGCPALASPPARPAPRG